jgi:hypothetical protein
MKPDRLSEGKTIAVEDMAISHIKNCIKMFEKMLKEDPGDQVYMGDSDFAADAVESENRINEETRENIHRWIDRLEDELKHRMRHQLHGKGEF